MQGSVWHRSRGQFENLHVYVGRLVFNYNSLERGRYKVSPVFMMGVQVSQFVDKVGLFHKFVQRGLKAIPSKIEISM